MAEKSSSEMAERASPKKAGNGFFSASLKTRNLL
jgi:hypothetical protein